MNTTVNQVDVIEFTYDEEIGEYDYTQEVSLKVTLDSDDAIGAIPSYFRPVWGAVGREASSFIAQDGILTLYVNRENEDFDFLVEKYKNM